MTGKQRQVINANRNLLPDRWWLDEFFREEVYATIRRMHNQGESNQEIARRTGVSDRGVLRIVHRYRDEGTRTINTCGVLRLRDGRACERRVVNSGDRCASHRS